MAEQKSDDPQPESWFKLEEQTSDNSKLHEYLKLHLEEFPKGDEELKMLKFSTGTSNPTFLLRKSGKEFVLRQKSPAEVYVGFHKVDVEYKIMSFLGATSFPVPKMHLFCEDTSIMGEEFYVMEYLKNRQFPDANLPGFPPEERKAIFEDAIKTLVQLQKVNTDEFDIKGIGKRENVLKDRLDMLEEGYNRVEKEKNIHIHRLIDWLKGNIPKVTKKAVIHHTDFRIPNMLIHPEKPRILAVLDWEGASWGHPFEDLAYFCFGYYVPAELEMNLNLPFKLGYCSEGIPSKEELLSFYCSLTGDSLPLPDWKFFVGLVFLRAFCNMQTGIAMFSSQQQASGGIVEFIVAAIDSIKGLMGPLAEHICDFLGLE